MESDAETRFVMVIEDLFGLVVGAIAVVAAMIAFSNRRAEPPSRAITKRRADRDIVTSSVWVAEHRTVGNRTVVSAARKVSAVGRASEIAERRELGSIANDDPGYEHQLLDLLDLANNRAALLNSTPNA